MTNRSDNKEQTSHQLFSFFIPFHLLSLFSSLVVTLFSFFVSHCLWSLVILEIWALSVWLLGSEWQAESSFYCSPPLSPKAFVLISVAAFFSVRDSTIRFLRALSHAQIHLDWSWPIAHGAVKWRITLLFPLGVGQGLYILPLRQTVTLT